MFRRMQYSLVAVNVAMFSLLSYFAFTRNYAMLAYGEDGGYLLLNVMQQWNWTSVSLGFFANPFQGIGDLWFFVNTKLLPSYMLPMLLLGGDGEITQSYVVLSYCAFAVEMFLSTWILARALGLNWSAAIGAAWTLPLLAHPYFGYSLLYPILQLVPNFGTMICEFSLLVASINQLGRNDPGDRAISWRDLALAAAILLLMIILVASQPLLAVLWIPSLALVSFALILAATKRERVVKLAILVAISLPLLAFGPILFLYGMFTYTVSHFFRETLESSLSGLQSVSIAYGDSSTGPYGPKLFAAGLAGLALAVIFGQRNLRAMAIATLLSVTCIVAAGSVFLKWDFWRGPAPLYFEFPIWPLYVIFAWWGATFVVQRLLWGVTFVVQRLFRRLTQRIGWVKFWILPRQTELAAVVVLSIMLAALAYGHSRKINDPVRTYPVPPSKPPMIALLEERVGLIPGALFRGRVATLELLSKPEPVGWNDFGTVDGSRYVATGNEYHLNGLWYHNIPTLFEYSQAMSPAFFRGVTRLLSRSSDRQLRNVVVLRGVDAHALGLLGVRFVIADAKLNEPFREVMTEKTHDNEVLFLYEVPDVNLGTYGPTEVRIVKDFDLALDSLGEVEFDPKRSVIVFDPMPTQEKLSPLKNAQLRMISDGYSVEANSDGTSLLVLPVEFSHCLQLRDFSNKPERAQLLRVNAIETGLLFQGHITANIQYFTGMFQNSTCRIQDSIEFSHLLSLKR